MKKENENFIKLNYLFLMFGFILEKISSIFSK